MSQIDRDLAFITDEEVEISRPFTTSLWRRIVLCLDGLKVATDGLRTGATLKSMRDGGLSHSLWHNHGYGRDGLGWWCITAQGVNEVDYSGEPAELLGRHMPAMLDQAHTDGEYRFAAFKATANAGALDGAGVNSRGVYSQPNTGIQFYGEPGCIEATLRVRARISWNDRELEVGTIELTAAVARDGDSPDRLPVIVWTSTQPLGGIDTNYAEFTIANVPVAPQKWNRVYFTLGASGGSGTAATFDIASWHITPERNGT